MTTDEYRVRVALIALWQMVWTIFLWGSPVAYIDDWKHITDDERRFLQEPCKRETCSHARMMHGTVSRTRSNGGPLLSFTGHQCETCGCREFCTTTVISWDDALDSALALDGTHTLADFGIAPLPPEEKTPEKPPEAW